MRADRWGAKESRKMWPRWRRLTPDDICSRCSPPPRSQRSSAEAQRVRLLSDQAPGLLDVKPPGLSLPHHQSNHKSPIQLRMGQVKPPTRIDPTQQLPVQLIE